MSIVFVTHNPLEADEVVFVTDDASRVEEKVYVKCTPYKIDKIVYVVDQTDELMRIFQDPRKFAVVRNDLGKLSEFSLRNCGVKRIDRVVAITGDIREATTESGDPL